MRLTKILILALTLILCFGLTLAIAARKPSLTVAATTKITPSYTAKPALAAASTAAFFTACNSGGVTILDDVSPNPATSAGTLTFYEDTGTSQRNWYVGYSIKNNAATTSSDVWVKLDTFSGGGLRIGLATNEDGIVHIGPLAAGETKQAFFYLYDSAGSGSNTALSETFQVNLYYGDPALTSEICDYTDTINAVVDDISASANKVHTTVSGPNPPSLGGIFTMTVTGESGVLGSTQVFALSPATDAAWPAKSFQLSDITTNFWGGQSCPDTTGGVPGTTPTTTNDRLVYVTPVGTNSCHQTIYTFVAVGTTSSPTTVQPVNHINSGGTNMKHTGSYTQPILPVQPASNTTTLSKSVSPTKLPIGGTATYTVTVTNAGSVAVSLDQFKDTLPTGASYVASSSTFNSSAISEPIASGQVLTWTGVFAVPANSSRTLVYQATIPNTIGTYTNSVYGLIGTDQIDTTTTTTDNQPATATVTVSPEADLAISKTNGTTSVSGGGTTTYTIVVTNNGPSPANNAKFTDPAVSWLSVTGVTCGSTTGGAACPTAGNTTVALMQGTGIVIPTLPANGTVTFTVTGNVSSSASGSVANSATATTPSGTADLVSGNNTATDTDTATPLAVWLSEFTARPKRATEGGVSIQWRTGYEVDTIGFNLYREDKGRRVLLTASPVAGSALLTRAQTVLTAGNSYVWTDPAGAAGAVYWLEELEMGGVNRWHGPVQALGEAEPVGSGTLKIQRARLVSELNEFTEPAKQIEYAATNVQPNDAAVGRVGSGGALTANTSLQLQFAAARPAAPWTAANQAALKMTIRKDGWYRVTQAELAAAGFNTNVNPQLLQLFAAGVEVPLKVTGNYGTGLGYVEFYGRALDLPSTDAQVYWLVAGNPPSQPFETNKGLENGHTVVTNFRSTVERKDRVIYFSGLLNGDAENWFGPIISSGGVSQQLSTRFLDKEVEDPATLELTLQGATNQTHLVKVQVNGRDVGNVSFANRQQATARLEIPARQLLDGANEIRLQAVAGGSDVSVIERLRLSYARSFCAENNRLNFSLGAGEVALVYGFSSPNLRVLQLSSPDDKTSGGVREILVTPERINGGYGFKLQSEGGVYLALTDELAERVPTLQLNQPSDWRARTNAAKFIILTHRDFQAAAERLAQARRASGLTVAVVDIEDAYDEFSYGPHTPQAIKDLLTYARTNWQGPPLYALFIGDATSDPRNYLGLGNLDFVPTKLGDTAYLETALDNWFVDANDDGLPEIALGRLPVRTAAQADAVVAKILGVPADNLSRNALLVSDRTVEGVDFKSISEQLARLLPAQMPKQFINRNDGSPDQIRTQIVNNINLAQPVIVNWQGHGSTQVWTGDGLLRAQDAPSLTNLHASLFVMTTCLNGYFTDPNQISLGEAVLLNAPGGAFAVISSSALNQPYAQQLFNQTLYSALFSQGQTLGEAMTAARLAAGDRDVRNSYVLFGDPTLRFAATKR